MRHAVEAGKSPGRKFNFGAMFGAWRKGDADADKNAVAVFEAVKLRFPPGSSVRARLNSDSGEFFVSAVVLEYAEPKRVDGEPVLSVAVFAATSAANATSLAKANNTSLAIGAP
jgi:hypothetical protein